MTAIKPEWLGHQQRRRLKPNAQMWVREYNKLYDQMQAVQSELKGREGEQRKALVALHQHPNAQVRLMAAHATLVIAPKAARDTLQALSESKIFPQAASAGMALDRLDSGKYKPT